MSYAGHGLLPPEFSLGRKPMLHFCPQCEQHYDCQPELQLICGSLHFPHSLRCGTFYQWRCPECAKKTAILPGKKSPSVIPFFYTQAAA
jgi:hypothetical protein